MIAYRKGSYKYQLSLMTISHRPEIGDNDEREGLWYFRPLLHSYPAAGNGFIEIIQEADFKSVIAIRDSYAWDGASGPTIDTKDTMVASLVHDALWQLIEEGHLPEKYRKQANSEFYAILIASGVPRWRARLWYWAVSKLGSHWVKHFGTKRKTIKAT